MDSLTQMIPLNLVHFHEWQNSFKKDLRLMLSLVL